MNILDVIGPVMIGPSSSHTAGAVRLGAMARAVFGGLPEKAEMTLYGSFAQTYKGHGTDVALVAGLLGWATDNAAIPDSFQAAREAGMAIAFIPTLDITPSHPNTVRFQLNGNGRSVNLTGISVGGGQICLTEIDSFAVEATGEFPCLLTVHEDKPGVVALVSSVLSNSGINIAQMRVSRRQKGGVAVMLVETDQAVEERTLAALEKLPHILQARAIPPVI